MRQFMRYLSRQASRAIPVQWLLNRDIPCFLPFYHVVSDEPLPHVLNYPYRNRAAFMQELEFLLKHFQPVTLQDLVNKKCTGRMFHLSFDDGLRQCSEVIAPLLIQKGIPATFFINTAFTGNKKLFHRYKASLILNHLRRSPHPEATQILMKHNLTGSKILQADIGQTDVLDAVAFKIGLDFDEFLMQQQPYMTMPQIKNLASQGFTIGAHSHNHPEFHEIAPEEQLEEVRNSMHHLDNIVNPGIRAFSFPFTDSGVSGTVLKTLKQKGLCDITFGTAGIKNDTFDFHRQRYPVERQGSFIRNLKEEILYYELRKPLGRATVIHPG